MVLSCFFSVWLRSPRAIFHERVHDDNSPIRIIAPTFTAVTMYFCWYFATLFSCVMSSDCCRLTICMGVYHAHAAIFHRDQIWLPRSLRCLDEGLRWYFPPFVFRLRGKAPAYIIICHLISPPCTLKQPRMLCAASSVRYCNLHDTWAVHPNMLILWYYIFQNRIMYSKYGFYHIHVILYYRQKCKGFGLTTYPSLHWY